MADPTAALASIQELLDEYQARAAAAEEALADRDRRLAQISELAHLEAEQPGEQPAE